MKEIETVPVEIVVTQHAVYTSYFNKLTKTKYIKVTLLHGVMANPVYISIDGEGR